MKYLLIIGLAFFLQTYADAQVRTGSNGFKMISGDGRFTLGAEGKRLMYGYPYPNSTSHFLINVNGRIGTNGPIHRDSCIYLSAKRNLKGFGKAPVVRTEFEFEGVKIRQVLTPINKHFQQVTHKDSLAQYYEVRYELSLKNPDDQKDVALMLLFDTMIDDNDACTVSGMKKNVKDKKERSKFAEFFVNLFRGKKVRIAPVRVERKFKGKRSDEYLLFKKKDNLKEMLGVCVLRHKEANLFDPDYISIGRWPEFFLATAPIKAKRVKYYDSALMLEWEKKTLKGGERRICSTAYGLPDNKKPTLELLVDEGGDEMLDKETFYLDMEEKMRDARRKQERRKRKRFSDAYDDVPPVSRPQKIVEQPTVKQVLLEDTIIVYYGIDAYKLKEEDKIKIMDQLADKEIEKLALYSFADALGGDGVSSRVSNKRLTAAQAFLESKDFVVAKAKSLGNSQADKTRKTKRYGDQKDRRVEVIYRHKKVVKE